MAAKNCEKCERGMELADSVCSGCGGSVAVVTITRFRLPFWHLVGFMIQCAIAAIPAAIIVGIIYAVVVVFLGGIFKAMGT